MKLLRVLEAHHDTLGLTRQQAVTLGKIMARPGATGAAFPATNPGPGGGPDATPENVGLLVLAALAGGMQSRAAEAAWSLNTVPVEGTDAGAAVIVGSPEHRASMDKPAMSFGMAVSRILAAGIPVERIEVRRGEGVAAITWADGSVSRFGTDYDMMVSEARSGFRVVASIDGEAVATLARAIAA